MKKFLNTVYEMRSFLLLWLGQSFSSLGSAMTAYALVIWSYTSRDSALMTALLMVCSYAPYVILSIFAGTLADRWNKKITMLVCDTAASLTTVAILILLKSGQLELRHIYIINVLNGLMNTVQQPASEVAVTRLLPEKYYQKVGGLRYFSNALSTILTPILATAFMGLFGLDAVLFFDLATFMFAAVTLLLFIKIPEGQYGETEKPPFFESVRSGIKWLGEKRGLLWLILYFAAINLVSSMYNAALPAMLLSRNGGSEQVMGIVSMVTGISMLLGSVVASLLKEPKNRIKVICNCLLVSMSTENLLLAVGRNVWIWCIGGMLGWIPIPLMSANLDAVMRSNIPAQMQGRVYSVRNSFQFFTIPVGYLLGGALVDYVFEPFMAAQNGGLLVKIFGAGKGSGAALFFMVLAVTGVAVCLIFRNIRSIKELGKQQMTD